MPRRDSGVGTRKGERTFNILELMEMRDLIKAKKSQGQVGDYAISFEYKENGRVWYSALDGIAPCGYTSLHNLTTRIATIMED